MRPRGAFREPMVWLVAGLPAAAVLAGIATIVLAVGSDAGDARVRRIAQTQTTDLAPDQEAARRALRGELRLDGEAVRLALTGEATQAPGLQLVLRHALDPARDREARLVRAGEGLYLGRLDGPRASGAYNAELAPEGGEWRLVGRLEPAAVSTGLAPKLEAP